MSEWLPIESAPKDSLVLLNVPKPPRGDSEVPAIVVGWFEKDWGGETGHWVSGHSTVESCYESMGPCSANMTLNPTHWMPLPPPPQELGK